MNGDFNSSSKDGMLFTSYLSDNINNLNFNAS